MLLHSPLQALASTGAHGGALVLAFDRSCPFTTGVYMDRAARALGYIPLSSEDEAAGDPSLPILKIDDSRHWDSSDERLLSHDRRAFWAIDTHTAFERVLEIARRFPIVFAAQRDGVEALRSRGISARWLPLAAEPEDAHADRFLDRDIDVAFIGSLRCPDRLAVLRAIDAAFDSFAFETPTDPRRIGELYGRAKVVINRSVAGDVNMRVFEAASAGAVIVTDRISASQWEGLDLRRVDYGTIREALRAIEEVLHDATAADAIRDHNRAVVRRRHSYRLRLRAMLDAIPSPDEECSVAPATKETSP